MLAPGPEEDDGDGDGDVFWVSASLAISAMLVLAAIFFITGFTELLVSKDVDDDVFPPPELFLGCCCWTLLTFLLLVEGAGLDARSFRSILSPGFGLGATGGGVRWVLDRNVTELSVWRLSLTLDLLPVLVTGLFAAAAAAPVTKGGFCSCFFTEVVLFRSDLESDFGPIDVLADNVLSTGALKEYKYNQLLASIVIICRNMIRHSIILNQELKQNLNVKHESLDAG